MTLYLSRFRRSAQRNEGSTPNWRLLKLVNFVAVGEITFCNLLAGIGRTMSRPAEAKSTINIINNSSNSTKNDIAGSDNKGRDFLPLSIEEYDEDDEITIEDEDYIYELDVIDNHYSSMEHHLAVQQRHRIRRRRCMVWSACFVAILVAVVASSMATLQALIRPNRDNNSLSEGSLPDSFFPANTTTFATAAAASPDNEALEEIPEAIRVKPPASRPGTSISSATATSEETQIAASTVDTSTSTLECAEGELCFQVVGTIPHDTSSFTQGLTFSNGVLYESTGLYGQSKVRKLDVTTGDAIASVDLESQYFGEGMTVTDNNTLIQITWKEQQGFVYDATTLERLGGFTYSTTTNEGWGITYIPHVKQLVVSDGSNMLHFWDATINNFPELKRIPVQRKDGTSVKSINELEYYHGYILANIWYSDTILKIHPETGLIEHEYDFSTLWPPEERVGNGDVLNGISISDKEDELFVTGKLWPKIYRIRLKGI